MARLSFVFPVALILLGCGKSTAPTASPQKNQQTDPSHADANYGPADSAAQNSQNAEITAALSKLTVEDRALATKQNTCPVSDELLGSMGAPIRVDVKGQTVFICCEACRDKLLATPDEYLAKLKH